MTLLRARVTFCTNVASATREHSIRLRQACSSFWSDEQRDWRSFLSGVDKEYEAIIRLGFATDTGDRTGKPIPDDPATAREQKLGPTARSKKHLASLRGEIEQVPPMYSAKKLKAKSSTSLRGAERSRT